MQQVIQNDINMLTRENGRLLFELDMDRNHVITEQDIIAVDDQIARLQVVQHNREQGLAEIEQHLARQTDDIGEYREALAIIQEAEDALVQVVAEVLNVSQAPVGTGGLPLPSIGADTLPQAQEYYEEIVYPSYMNVDYSSLIIFLLSPLVWEWEGHSYHNKLVDL